jgi:hypothetical protein
MRCLIDALATACVAAELKIVHWLIDVTTLSCTDTIKWLLTTASARGDINTIRQPVQRDVLHTIDIVSDGLKVACHMG